MLKICRKVVLFELCLWKKKEERRWTRLNFSSLVLSILLMVSKTFGVDTWPSRQKPTIHRKISKSSILHHTLTDVLPITTMFFFFPYDLLFTSYTTISVIRLKCTYMYREKRPFPIPYSYSVYNNQSLRFRRIYAKFVDQTSPERKK